MTYRIMVMRGNEVVYARDLKQGDGGVWTDAAVMACFRELARDFKDCVVTMTIIR